MDRRTGRREGDGRQRKGGNRGSEAGSVEPPIAVDGRWLLRALLVLGAAALVCAYLTLSLLFWQGQWQLVLHPVRTSARPGTIGGRGYEVVRFGPDGSGLAQRVGWWVPATREGPFRHLVLLYLPSGDGSLAEETATLDAVAASGMAVFAIDWRGAGESADVHPNEQRMHEDAEAAWRYLVDSRQVPGGRVVPYGAGVGAAVALGLTREHHEIAAMVLDAPRYDVEKTIRADPRVSMLPVGALLRDRFALEPALGTSTVPKLIVTRAAKQDACSLSAGEPKMTVAMPRFDAAALSGALSEFLRRFAPPAPGAALPVVLAH